MCWLLGSSLGLHPSLLTPTRTLFGNFFLSSFVLSVCSLSSILFNNTNNECRDEAEMDLNFLGFIVLQNKLKPETPPIITELKAASVRPVMITGTYLLLSLFLISCSRVTYYTNNIPTPSSSYPLRLFSINSNT